jgi:4-hydroxybenzoyl-CoA thioesterase
MIAETGMTAAATFAVDKQVRFHLCDPAGIMFYPQYFVLMNELVEDWFDRGLDLPFRRFHGIDRMTIPMRRVECDFLAPSALGETLRFSLAVARLGTTSFTLAVEARCGDAIRVRATLVMVYASAAAGAAVEMPPDFRARLARFAS